MPSSEQHVAVKNLLKSVRRGIRILAHWGESAGHLEQLAKLLCSAVVLFYHASAAWTIVLASAVVAGVTWAIWHSVFTSKAPTKTFVETLHFQVNQDYKRGDIRMLLQVQLALRAALVGFVVLDVRGPINKPSSQLEYTLALGVALAANLYFLESLISFKRGWDRNREALKTIPAETHGILWWPAVYDVGMVSLLIMARPNASFYHLAFLIPCLGAWLFSHGGRGFQLFKLIWIGLSLRYSVVTLASIRWPQLAQAVGMDEVIGLRPEAVEKIFATEFLPALLFWTAATLPLALLKKLRTNDKRTIQMLESIAEHIIYPVFRKNAQREFEFVNRAFAEKVGLPREKIVGQTDEKLKIDTEEFRDSDGKVLGSSDPNKVHQAFERPFGNTPDDKVIFTTKKAISDGGKIVGLVGVCEPGTPMQVSQMYFKLLKDLPYCAVIKDEKGHIKWANSKFLKDDVGLTLEEVQNLRPGGATDEDFYPEMFPKFMADDQDVIREARSRLQRKEDPCSMARVRKELHCSPKTKKKRWVEVVKVPWLNSDGTEVMGVQVYFHDIHQSFLAEGTLGRWLKRHQPYLLDRVWKAQKTRVSTFPAKVPAPFFQELVVVLVDWLFRLTVEERLSYTATDFKFQDLNWMKQALRDILPENISLEFEIETKAGDHITGDQVVIEAAILLLAMNAAEACCRVPYYRGQNGAIKIHVFTTKDQIFVEVTDNGIGFGEIEGREISAREKLNPEGQPGSGFFILDHFAREMEGSAMIVSDGQGEGAKASFICSRSAFTAKARK